MRNSLGGSLNSTPMNQTQSLHLACTSQPAAYMALTETFTKKRLFPGPLLTITVRQKPFPDVRTNI